MTRSTVMLATLACVTLVAADLGAQGRQFGWGLGVGTGLERSESFTQRAFRRARTRVVVPVDMRVDEFPGEGIGLVAFAELEPRASLGGSVRYLHWLSPAFVGFVGGTAVLFPESLYGAEVGFQVRLPFSKRASIFLEPSLTALPLGTDLPGDRLLVWGLISAGFHAD